MSTSLEAASAAKFYMKDYRERADARLAELLAEQGRSLGARPFGAARYHALLADYTLRGGKRLRGALVQLGFEAAAAQSSPAALEGSLSFELLHAFLLAYDDYMDRDETRRGGPSLHVTTAAEARRRGAAEPEHRGLSVTLLLGLFAQSLAFDCLHRAGASLAARRYFDEVSRGVVEGQLLDVIAVDEPSASLAEISIIHQLKTGLYTTEGPLVLGALLAGAPRDGRLVRALEAWARPLGEAFQLVDDILGAVGDAEETGKPSYGDLREGKRSAVLEEALARSVGAARERLAALAGRPLDAAEAAEARDLIVKSGAVEAVRDRARLLAEQGNAALQAGGLGATTRLQLEGLAQLIVERQN